GQTVRLTLYTRADCPLCDEAKAVLARVQGELGDRLALDIVDIGQDERLIEAYGTLIPVVTCGDETLFVGKVSPHRLKAMIGHGDGASPQIKPRYKAYLERLVTRMRRSAPQAGMHHSGLDK